MIDDPVMEDRASRATAIADYLNGLAEPDLLAALERCCGSPRWAVRMGERRPFTDDRAVFGAAEAEWWDLDRDDWLRAFAAHPRIGDRGASERWSRAEQAGVASASGEMLDALSRANRAYEERFGYVFLVCATGLSARTMLDALTVRLESEPEVELRTAAAEQAKITRLRLQRLACDSTERRTGPAPAVDAKRDTEQGRDES